MRLGAMRLARPGLTIVVLALTLMLAACGGAASSPKALANATPTALATPTAAPVPHLNWRTVTTPIDLSHGGVSMDSSPVNGRNAWICGADSNGRFPIYRTQDAGATWVQISTLAPAAPQPFDGCSVSPDENAANGVAVWFPTSDPSQPGPASGAAAYYSADGGADWTALPQNWWIQQVATSAAVTYALVNDLAHDAGASELYASSDNLATWHAINPTSQTMQQNTQFWAATDSGEILFAPTGINPLYRSTDYGLHWTQALAQSGPAVSVGVAAWQGQSAGWLVCGNPAADSTQTLCSKDLGKTWTAEPSAAGLSGSCFSSTLTATGSTYATCRAPQTASGWALYRLTPGASLWRPIGDAPYRYVTMSQSGQVWCEDGNGVNTYVLDQLP